MGDRTLCRTRQIEVIEQPESQWEVAADHPVGVAELRDQALGYRLLTPPEATGYVEPAQDHGFGIKDEVLVLGLDARKTEVERILVVILGIVPAARALDRGAPDR